jgi:iron complex outermembrane receptor protein
VPRIPPLRLLGGLELRSDAVTLRGEVEWADEQDRVPETESTTDGFTLVNLSASWRPFPHNRGVALTAAADNLFDVEARRAASFTRDFVPLPGRDIRIGFAVSF